MKKAVYVWEAGILHPQPDMYQRRLFHAILYDDGSKSVLIFGGSRGLERGPMKRSEQYFLRPSRANPLPNLFRARAKFNVCMHNSIVYICGGGDPSCETFNVTSGELEMLGEFSIPAVRVSLTSVQAGELTIVCPSTVYRYDLHTKQIRAGETLDGEWLDGEFACVVAKDGAVFVMKKNAASVWRVGLDTGAVQEVSMCKECTD